jgi:hypothetical protein
MSGQWQNRREKFMGFCESAKFMTANRLQRLAKGPLWLKSGRDALKFRCPLFPRKRTFLASITMSALGQKRL